MAEVGCGWMEWQMEVPRETDRDVGGIKPSPIFDDEDGPYIYSEMPYQTFHLHKLRLTIWF